MHNLLLYFSYIEESVQDVSTNSLVKIMGIQMIPFIF
jgi:hypothetical protein